MFDEFHIEGLKCFNFQIIEFSSLTIFAGGNGAGKSSVIQALLLFRQTIDRLFIGRNGVRILPSITGLGNFNIEMYQNEFNILLNGPYLLQMGQANKIFSENSNQEIKLCLSNAGRSIKFSYYSSGKHAEHLLTGKLLEASENIYNLIDIPFGGHFIYLHAERLGPRKALNMSNNSEIYSNEIHIGFQGEFTSYAIYKADQIRAQVHEGLRINSSSIVFSHHVEEWLNVIIPGQQLGIKVLPEVTMASLEYNTYSAPNTAFGVSYVLPIIVAGLFLSSEKDAVLVVENPEAHLHPAGQSYIGRFLALVAECGVQVIIETHSEHVINGARLELAKRKKSDKVVINFFEKKVADSISRIEKITANETGELSNWPSGFFDQEQMDLRELFLLKRKIKES